MKQRVIKFRAWSEKFSGMIYPNDTDYQIKIGNGDIHSVWSVWKDGRDDECVEIMQFTGLLDKNGKEIYEGDIILNPLSTKPEDKGFLVSWMVHGFYLSNVRGNMFEHEENKFIPFDDIETNFEIIGNIYEHPNLLNPKQWKIKL